jgi:hypothetical protein
MAFYRPVCRRQEVISDTMEAVRCLFLTYEGSRIADEREFESRLKGNLAEEQVFTTIYGRLWKKVHVDCRFYGVRETRLEQQGEGEVTCFPLHRYEVLVLFDYEVAFKDNGHLREMFEVGDGSMVKVTRVGVRTNEEGWKAVTPTDEEEWRFAWQVQDYVEREIPGEGVERHVFGRRFDFDQEFFIIGEEQ